MGARLARSTAFRLALFALLAAALVWPLLPFASYANEFRDAQVLGLHERVAALSVRKFGELPLWNPYYCGGLYGLGAPQSRFASPFFLFTFLFGVERAETITIFVLAILGMEGTYRWLRLRVTSESAALRIAPVFALSGYFAIAALRGWTNFFGFELLPWIMLGVTLSARGKTRGLALAAVGFALVLGFGGTFAAPLIAVAAVAEGLRALTELPRDARRRGLLMLGAAAIFMATCSAFKLWPLAETLLASPRIMAGTPGHLPKALFSFLWRPLDIKDGEVTDYGTFFVGPVFLALVALGGADRRSARSLLVTMLFLWLAAGYARKPALFALLRELPVFAALRYPERFLWIGILFASEPAAHALARIPYLGDGERWRKGSAAVLTAAVALTVVLQLICFSRVTATRSLGTVVLADVGTFRQARGNRWLASHYQGLGVGSLSCWETHPVVMSTHLRGDLAHEEYPADRGAGTVERRAWSPNQVSLHADLTKPTHVIVNQNWHPGWKVSAGELVSEDGLLAVALPAGAHDVTFTFRPTSARGGAITTALALFALAILGLRARRGRVPFTRGNHFVSAFIVLAPAAAFFALYRTNPEPVFPPPPQRNANGQPAIVAEVENTSTVSARFTLPVALEGAGVTPFDPNLRTSRIDLYLRRHGSIPRTTAVFVHIERREGQPIPEENDEKKDPKREKELFNLDHQVVGGSFYLSDAPQGALVHDVVGANLTKAIPGLWDVKIGIGHFSGKRSRPEEMVTVGTLTIP